MEFPSMLGVSDCAGFISGSLCSSLLMWPSASPNSVGAPDKIDFAAPVNASPAALRLHSHDSGSGWFAIPFLWDSFLPCSMPVYPGALGVVPKNHVCPSKGGGPQKPRDIQSRGRPVPGHGWFISG